MRIFRAVAVVALLVGPAYAQSQGSVPRYGDLAGKSPEEIRAEKEADKAYQKSLGNIPDKTTTTDPWGNVRSNSAPQAAAKTPAPKRSKTGSTAN